MHEWSSLVCTLFLFILCLTGLPLIFSDEIAGDALAPAGPVSASLDRIVNAHAADPVFVRVAADEGRIYLGERGGGRPLLFDARTGRPLLAGAAKPAGLQGVLLALHAELFAGIAGRWFIACVGLSALVSVLSGIAVYAPFARGRVFGDVRRRSPRLAWLDRHNFLGIVAAAWLLVVTVTGFMNAIDRPLFNLWRAGIGHALPRVVGTRRLGPDLALAKARAAAPHMVLETVIFPGGAPGVPGYYLIWGTGATPLTSHLTGAVAVDAVTGVVPGEDLLPMPWYLRLLDVSRPLHFGDYGGLPFKFLWALLDGVTLAILGSGLYLWLARRRLRASEAAGR